MFLILTASSDTYITNKIIRNSFSASDANVGRAGTLDLFKLYNESTLEGITNPIELSRILLKFDYSKIATLATEKIDYSDSSFKAYVRLFDVMGGQATPADFTLIAFPLSRSFAEGNGRDVIEFRDIGVANYYTASLSNNLPVTWSIGGANKQGNLGNSDIDITVSGNLGTGLQGLGKTQYFESGEGNLKIDVTEIVSASLAGIITNHGFRISFTGSEETDTKTRFVKRFGSRHARNMYIRPRLEINYNDSIQDNNNNFFFDVSGSVFLNSFERGKLASIKSGSALTPITGSNSLILTLKTGSYSKVITASQHKIPGNLNTFMTGVYSASFAVFSNDNTMAFPSASLHDLLRYSGSVDFTSTWSSLDGTVGFLTSSLKITAPFRTSFDVTPRDLDIHITNLRSEYSHDEEVKLRAFVIDYNAQPKAKRVPFKLRSVDISKCYYSVIDAQTNETIIPFSIAQNATRLSNDSEGLYFNFFMWSLFPQRTYRFKFKVYDSDQVETIEPKSVFKVV